MTKLDIELNDTVHGNSDCHTFNDQDLVMLAKSNKWQDRGIPRYAQIRASLMIHSICRNIG
jgi:hypothetical protein